MVTFSLVPIFRLMDAMVRSGLTTAWRLASWPTRRSPVLVNATTEGVSRLPSAFGITVGWPASITAITEFVVPRSMPTDFAIFQFLLGLPPGWCSRAANPVMWRRVILNRHILDRRP